MSNNSSDGQGFSDGDSNVENKLDGKNETSSNEDNASSFNASLHQMLTLSPLNSPTSSTPIFSFFSYETILTSPPSSPSYPVDQIQNQIDMMDELSLDSEILSLIPSSPIQLFPPVSAEQFSLGPIKIKRHVKERWPVLPEAKKAMMEWLVEHRNNPYPTEAEKLYFESLGATRKQVNNFFMNKRQRNLKDTFVPLRPSYLRIHQLKVEMIMNHLQNN